MRVLKDRRVLVLWRKCLYVKIKHVAVSKREEKECNNSVLFYGSTPWLVWQESNIKAKNGKC